jgi:hypothetical protein
MEAVQGVTFKGKQQPTQRDDQGELENVMDWCFS